MRAGDGDAGPDMRGTVMLAGGVVAMSGIRSSLVGWFARTANQVVARSTALGAATNHSSFILNINLHV